MPLNSPNEMTPEISPSTLMVTKTFKQAFVDSLEKEGPLQPPKETESPISNTEYLQMCIDLMGLGDVPRDELADRILPEALLQRKLREIEMSSSIKIRYPETHIVQLCIIPFDLYEHALSEQDLRLGHYLSEIMIEKGKDGKTIAGYSTEPSYVHRLMPKAFSQGLIEINKYETDDILQSTENDLVMIVESYKRAYYKLREAINRVALSH